MSVSEDRGQNMKGIVEAVLSKTRGLGILLCENFCVLK